MDVQVIFRRPFHHLVDDFHRFAGAVDIEHQVTYTVDNDQAIAFPLPQGVVDDSNAYHRRIFTQADEVKILAVGCRWQSDQPQDTCQYVVAVEATLLRVHVQDSLLSFGQVCPVVQYLLTGQRCGDNG